MVEKQRYFLVYKPFGMLSQFSIEGDHATLKDLFDFPKDVYPVGRLDADSEGLLVLSNDSALNNALLHPQKHVQKIYWAQVEGLVSQEALKKLEQGVQIKLPNGSLHNTLPCTVQRMDMPSLPDRNPPIRFRQQIPTSWIQLTIHEGKNRQVRKMCAKVGFPVLRLVRVGFGKLKLENYPNLAQKKYTEIRKGDIV